MSKRVTVIFLLIVFMVVGFTAYSEGGSEEAAVDTTRPIWIWGATGHPGDYREEDFEVAQAWAIENFGHPFRVNNPPRGDNIASLNILLAEGKFPDIIRLQGYTVPVQKMIVDLAKFGKSMAVDKYYNDPENFPILFEAGKVKWQLDAVRWNGKAYAAPGSQTLLATDPVIKPDTEWWFRWDALKEFGGNTLEEAKYVPTNLDELYDFLKQAMKLGLTDRGGRTSHAFGIGSQRTPAPAEWLKVLDTMKGAGWEVDDQMRLMPKWASEEFYEACKYVNLLFREGLMHPNFDLLIPSNVMENRSLATPLVHAGMTNFGPSIYRGEVITENDGDRVAAAKDPTWDIFYMCVMPPLKEPDGTIGRITMRPPSYNVISKQNPNPDATFRLLEHMLTDEGDITHAAGMGPRGVTWEFIPENEQKGDPPLTYRLIGHEEPWVRDENGVIDWDATYKVKAPCYPDTTMASWTSPEKAKECPPNYLPLVEYYGRRVSQGFEERLYNAGYRAGTVEFGIPIDGREGTWTATQMDTELHIRMKAEVGSDIPSYQLVLYELSPLEAGAFATADQRLEQSLAAILTAESPAQFDEYFSDMLGQMIKVTNWKPVYEKKQKNWEAWMKSNNTDDTASLKTVTPRSEWKDTMGW